jgi:hypothetical protein
MSSHSVVATSGRSLTAALAALALAAAAAVAGTPDAKPGREDAGGAPSGLVAAGRFDPVGFLWGYIQRPETARALVEARKKMLSHAEGAQVVNKFNGMLAHQTAGDVGDQAQKQAWVGVFQKIVATKEALLGRPLTPAEKADAANEYRHITQESIRLARAGFVPEPMKNGSSADVMAGLIVGLVVGAALTSGVVYVDQPYYHSCSGCSFEARDAYYRGADHGYFDGRNHLSYDPYHHPRPGWYHGFCSDCERRAYLDGYDSGYRRGLQYSYP